MIEGVLDMKTVIALLCLLAVPFAVNSAPKEVTIKDNGRVSIRENGVKKELGTLRQVKTTSKGTEIYTNKKYNGPALVVDKYTKEIHSYSHTCKYGCSDEGDDDE